MSEVIERPFKWHLLSMNYNKGYLVKLLVEESVKILGMKDDLDKFIVLASIKDDDLFYGGLLSGYALVRCRFSEKMYYLLLGLPQAYGLIKVENKKKSIDVEKMVVEISQEEADKLIKLCTKRVETGKYFSVGNDVKITQGSFINFKGKILSISKNKIEVQVDLLGRKVSVQVDIGVLEHD